MNFKNFFDNFFPPPDFLNIPYAGISISDNVVRCLQFSKKGGSVFVSKYKEAFIAGKDEAVAVLREMKKNFDFDYAKVSLPEEKAYLFTTKIPPVKNEEVRGAVEFKMEENVPVSADELIFDYAVVEPQSHADHLNVVVSALPIAVLDKYVETFQTAGIPLLSLEIESQAIARAVIKTGDKSTRLIVHFGKEKVGLYVSSGRVVHFTSTVSTKETPSEAMPFLAQEIKKLYTYWHTLKENAGAENKKIIQIVVCGDISDEQILPYLSSHLKTQTIFGNVWTNAFDVNRVVPQIPFSDSLKYAAAVGLALPSAILI
jgi:Tfp pilus assembly PilM family ATPase